MITSNPSRKIRMNPASLVRQLRPVALLKAAQFVGVVLYGILIPRWMGPELFGQFAVLFSLIALWRTTCNLGGRYIFGRFVPGYALRGESERVREVFMHVLATRAVIALMGAPVLFWVLDRLLPDASRTTLVAGTLTYVTALVAGPMFGVQFGLNRLGLSMANDPARRFLFLILFVLLGGTASLERASLALLLAQLFVLGLGLVLSGRLFMLRRSAFEVSTLFEHVRFGAVAYSASLLMRLPWRLGESALALQEVDSVKIAYFSVAVAATGALAKLMGSATSLLIPSLSALQAAGDRQRRDQTLGLALRYLLVAAGLFSLLVIAFAPVAIENLLGESYLGALPNLSVLLVGTLAWPLCSAALALAVVTGTLRFNVYLGLVAATVFGLAALVLVPTLESQGASAAVTISILSAAIVGALLIRNTGVPSEARIGRLSIATGAAGVVLLMGGLSPIAAVISATVYVVLLSALRVIRWGEVGTFVRASRLMPP